MKKYKKFSALVACVATMAVGAGLVMGGNSASAANHEFIYFYTRENGVPDSVICSIYDSNETYGYSSCDASYGSYNSDTKTLTLGAGVNNLPNGRVSTNIGSMTITASDNIQSAISAVASSGVIFDFGEYSFTEVPYKTVDAANATGGDWGDGLIVKSGTMNVSFIDVSGPLEVKNGTININENPTIAIQTRGDLKISGGTINILGCKMAILNNSGEIIISGGTINIDNVELSGIESYNDIRITGGEINLKSAETPAGFGVLLTNGNDLIIDGGNLTIDGFDWGINGSKSKIYFNGGTTVIKNSVKHTVWISPAEDPENDIVFGEGMGIKEDTYVFYGDEYDGTGIADPNTVTITEGYTYRKHYGWEHIDGDSDYNDESDIKVPDTGAMSGETNGAMVAMISMGVLAAVAGGAYVANYATKRHSARAKFFKK